MLAISLLSVSGSTVTFFFCFFLAYICTVFCSAIPALPFEMKYPCREIKPNHSVTGAVRLCGLFTLELVERIGLDGEKAQDGKQNGCNKIAFHNR
jgi:hypothetical protein